MKLAILLLLFTDSAGHVRETYAMPMPRAECRAIKNYYDPERDDLPRSTIRVYCMYAGSPDTLSGK